MKKTFLLLCFTLFSFMFVNAQTATAPSGTGTASDPYLISNINNLYWVTQNTSSWTGKYFKQTADIDASTTSTWDSGAGFTPIGNATTFSGNYDGQGYTISGLFINRSTVGGVGLFGVISGSITIQNIRLVNVNITGGGNVGGLVGSKWDGSNTTSTISNCSTTGVVVGAGSSVGGMFGCVGNQAAVNIIRCFSTCTVSTTSASTQNNYGGLAGYVKGYSPTYMVKFTDCYATGNVSSNGGAGGFIGGVSTVTANTVGTWSTTNCYSTGLVAVSGTSGGSFGGFIGRILNSATGTVTNCFWDNQTSGQSTSLFGTGKTTAEMKTQSTYTGWDFTGETTNGIYDYWAMTTGVNSGYPILTGLNSNLHSIPFQNFVDYPEGVISDAYNAGPGMAIDQTSTTTEDSKMVVISSTTGVTFAAYIQALLNNGFTQIGTNLIENNVFYTLMNNNKLYYLYFTASTNQVRIIQDNSSRTLLNALDASIQGTGKTEFYIYSLDYTHGEGQTSKMDYWKIDCGTTLIIKLKDNSLFIIDSGHERQSSNAAQEGFLNFMYKITGQNVGTNLNIRGWFFSHAHGDHVYFTYPFLNKYHNVLNVESVLFNIPSFQTMSSGYDSGTFLMKQAFNTYYPTCKYVKLHTGQSFTLQGVKFDVLHTHEDAVSSVGKTTIGNFNDTSTILKMMMDGKTMLLLGDASTVCQNDMLSMYSAATLKSDCVQTAHHGYNNLTSLYKAIGAPLALFCNSELNVGKTSASYLGVINATSNVKMLYADPYTTKITVLNGSFQTENLPSYRSYFTTVKIPNLSVGTINTSGNNVALSTVLSQNSLNDQVIDKSVTGTGSKSVSEPCSLILDSTTSTKYCTDTIPATIAWTMKQPVTLKWYVIYTANDNATNAGRNPQKWVICGSNDGTNWKSIDSVNNANLPNVNYTGIAFAVSNPVPYQYYAIKIFSNAGANVMQFSEIGLYGNIGETTDVANSIANSDKNIQINTNVNNQITVNYNENLSSETFVSVYNTVGQKLVTKQIINTNTIIKVPVSGIYIVTLTNAQTNITKKVRLN